MCITANFMKALYGNKTAQPFSHHAFSHCAVSHQSPAIISLAVDFLKKTSQNFCLA